MIALRACVLACSLARLLSSRLLSCSLARFAAVFYFFFAGLLACVLCLLARFAGLLAC